MTKQAQKTLTLTSHVFVWELCFQQIVFGHPTSHSLLLYSNMKSTFCQNNSIGITCSDHFLRMWLFHWLVCKISNWHIWSFMWHLWGIVVQFWLSWQRRNQTYFEFPLRKMQTRNFIKASMLTGKQIPSFSNNLVGLFSSVLNAFACLTSHQPTFLPF